MTGDSARVALASGPGQRRRPLFIRQPFRDDSGQIVGLLRLALERRSRLGEAATARSAR